MERVDFSKDDLMDAGLLADQERKLVGNRLGELLKIGYTNGKQLHKRLNDVSNFQG